MPQYCVVPRCNSHIGGHKFPDDKEICLKWQVAIKRVDPKTKQLWKPGKYSVICHDHFLETDYRPTGLMGKRRLLKMDAVPTVFSFKSTVTPLKKRSSRLEKERSNLEPSVPDMSEVNVLFEETVPSVPEADTASKDVGVQCIMGHRQSLPSINVPIIPMVDQFKNNDVAVQYYTGFDNFQHFIFMFNVLGPAVNNLTQCSLDPIDQFLLTLMKLRQAKEDVELSIFFHVSESTVSNIINIWIMFLYFQLREIDIWPTREIIDQYMPQNFGRLFKSTRVVLDATEVPIQKPSHVEAQSATFSTYKNRNTLKTMIGITPRGLTSFVSDSYGGSASDRQITERSELVTGQLFDRGDSIMADRGIAVQDLFAPLDVKVNTPHFLAGKSQLEPEDVVYDRRIASKRIHVERVIGYAKTYKILQRPLPHSKVQMGSHIIYVCFMFCNFRTCIVNNMA